MRIRFRSSNNLSNRNSRTKVILTSILAMLAASEGTVRANDCTSRLYGTSYEGPDGLATFYSIDPANGSATPLGATGYERISAMDVDPATGILYATGEQPVTDAPVLITINRNTGNGTLVGEMSVNESIAGLSIRNSDSTIFGFGGHEGVFTVNSTDGSTTVLIEKDDWDKSGNGIAFSPTDDLYHADAENLHTVNQTTGLLTEVGPLSFNSFPEVLPNPKVSAMDYGPETGLYYVIVKGGGGAATYLATLDVTTNAVSHVGATADNMDGLAYFCEPSGTTDLIFKDGFETQ